MVIKDEVPTARPNHQRNINRRGTISFCALFAIGITPPALALSIPQSVANAIKSYPCVGHATRGNTHFVVIGTSHSRCQSAKEVRQVIEEVQPDGVVVELDPERVIRLTKEGTRSPNEEQLFGADFLAAIDTAQEKDIPLFIGDEYQKETTARLIGTVLEPASYGPGRLLKTFFSSNKDSSSCRVDLIRTFLADPMKLAPLLITALPPLVLLLTTAQSYHIDDFGTNTSIALSLLLSFMATCKVFNNLIADRDDTLASNANRAARVVSSVKSKEMIRARWTFTVNDEAAAKPNSDLDPNDGTVIRQTPLFTLKTPLETGKVRNLNLFEPRWLKMIDGVMAQPAESQLFGCVTCSNKFYSAIDVNGSEGRYADVIFGRRGTLAQLTQLVEGQRPVSGDRKVSARIEGRDSFVVEEEALSVSKEGYLVASDIICDDNICVEIEQYERDGECEKVSDDIKIVIVVGLLHANGVIDRLSRTKHS